MNRLKKFLLCGMIGLGGILSTNCYSDGILNGTRKPAIRDEGLSKLYEEFKICQLRTSQLFEDCLSDSKLTIGEQKKILDGYNEIMGYDKQIDTYLLSIKDEQVRKDANDYVKDKRKARNKLFNDMPRLLEKNLYGFDFDVNTKLENALQDDGMGGDVEVDTYFSKKERITLLSLIPTFILSSGLIYKYRNLKLW